MTGSVHDGDGAELTAERPRTLALWCITCAETSEVPVWVRVITRTSEKCENPNHNQIVNGGPIA